MLYKLSLIYYTRKTNRWYVKVSWMYFPNFEYCYYNLDLPWYFIQYILFALFSFGSEKTRLFVLKPVLFICACYLHQMRNSRNPKYLCTLSQIFLHSTLHPIPKENQNYNSSTSCLFYILSEYRHKARWFFNSIHSHTTLQKLLIP